MGEQSRAEKGGKRLGAEGRRLGVGGGVVDRDAAPRHTERPGACQKVHDPCVHSCTPDPLPLPRLPSLETSFLKYSHLILRCA